MGMFCLKSDPYIAMEIIEIEDSLNLNGASYVVGYPKLPPNSSCMHIQRGDDFMQSI